jgi:TolB-like protein/DNA-binding winged helix-turn-helix (wHTH) protein/Tfp pilus assembly protein PilF
MTLPHKELYEFSSFRLDVSERLLLRDGKRVSLTDKAFDTLCVLVRRNGELIAKDELMNEVWTDSIVEENNLDQKISMIRQALGARGKNKEKFIETVRGRGYRFLPAARRIETAQEDTDDLIPAAKKPETNFSAAPYETKRAGNVVTVAKWRSAPNAAENPAALPAAQASPEAKPAAHEKEQNEPVTDRKIPNIIRRNKRAAFLIAAVLTAVAGTFFALSRFSSDRTATSDAPLESIAVLPFVNESGNVENEYLTDGMTELLINSLSQLPRLSVKARSSVFRYKGEEISPRKVGGELNVQAVLLGRVAQRGDRLTLSVEMVDTRTENIIWSERYDRRQTELISLQSEIARDVSNKLRARLSGADEQRITKHDTADQQAYQLYLQGLYHLNKRTAEDIRKSIAFFRQATDKDPLYAKGYAWLAMAYMILPDYSHKLTRADLKDFELKRRAAVQRAQELDDSLAEVHTVLATLKEDFDFDVVGAEKHYRRAIELNPNFATAYLAYSRLLGALGRHEEAFAAVNKAHELDPFSRSIKFNIGARFYGARRFDEAIAQLKNVLEMEPDHPLSHLVLAMTYEAKGMLTEAIAETRVADVLLEKETAETAERQAAALTQALKTGGAVGYWQKKLELSRKDYENGLGSAYKIAVNFARLGDRERAVEQLEKSLAAREADFIFWIGTESAFDPLKNDPRFTNLLGRAGLLF